ncbi:hypothetical protein EX895_003060 [Sporisorium graminicola]|uniref:TPM domain-containing protein n=1 Tax=Sporisorium graminicola TaxID=280036 RepID=A0A4U7KTR4_9BASI|nr:hypothetical protein EX895_003060 [Sporisorium graminicola]TKY87964.1 hypothetical protein EX895_003060 [Sporisorium graminicola]
MNISPLRPLFLVLFLLCLSPCRSAEPDAHAAADDEANPGVEEQIEDTEVAQAHLEPFSEHYSLRNYFGPLVGNTREGVARSQAHLDSSGSRFIVVKSPVHRTGQVAYSTYALARANTAHSKHAVVMLDLGLGRRSVLLGEAHFRESLSMQTLDSILSRIGQDATWDRDKIVRAFGEIAVELE